MLDFEKGPKKAKMVWGLGKSSLSQHLGVGRKRSTDVLRQGKVQPISLTIEKEF